MDATIYICNGRSCKHYGCVSLIEYLQQKQFPHLKIKTQHCFAKCGDGCIVFSSVEERFYSYVNVNNINSIIDRALD